MGKSIQLLLVGLVFAICLMVSGCASTPKIDPERMVGEHPPEMIGGMQALYNVLRYPDSARRNNIQGTVVLEYVVNEDGRAEDIRVVQGINNELDTEAINALRRVRHKPGMKDGVPVPVKITLPVVFRLQ